MPYPKSKIKKWKQRAASLFLSRDEVKAFSPIGAEKMSKLNLASVAFDNIPPEVNDAIKSTLSHVFNAGEPQKFFMQMIEKHRTINDAVSICAKLTEICTGAWPSDEQIVGVLLAIDKNASFSPSRVSFQILSPSRNTSGKEGAEFDVVIIEAGLNENGSYYSPKVLQQHAHLFEGAKCYSYKYAVPVPGVEYTHIDKGGMFIRDSLTRNLVGVFKNVKYGTFKNAAGKTVEGLLARLEVYAQWARDLLKNADAAGNLAVVGLSIDVYHTVVKEDVPGIGLCENVLAINSVNEVTIVSHPAAGGAFIRMAAAKTTTKDRGVMDAILSTILAFPELAAKFGITAETPPDEVQAKLPEILALLCQMQATYAAQGAKVKKDELDKVNTAVAQLQVEMKKIADAQTQGNSNNDLDSRIASAVNSAVSNAVAGLRNDLQGNVQAALTTALASQGEVAATAKYAEAQLSNSTLPESAKQRIRQLFDGKAMRQDDINKLLQDEQAYIASLAPTQQFLSGQAPASSVSVTRDQLDRFQAAMDGMLLGKPVGDVPPFTSLHDSFYRITQSAMQSPAFLGRRLLNDARASVPKLGVSQQQHRNYLAQRRESLSTVRRATLDLLDTTVWAEVFGDSMRKALISFYKYPKYDYWRKVVSSIVPLKDFRTNRRQRIGGFADLSIVSQGGTYEELTWPGDEEVAYAPQKRGNTVSLTWETFVNDDLGAVKDVPRRLGITAAKTLFKFVFDFFRTNPTFDPDSTAVFHANHSNLGSTALSDAALDDRVFAMLNQTELSSSEVLGIQPKYLIVPNALSRTAFELTKATVSSVSGRTETLDLWYKEFALESLVVPYWTDATDWVLLADPNDWPTIEIGFLDGNEEPDLWIADQDTVGSTYSADKIGYKIRHVYGGDVLDYRSMDKAVVA